MEQVNLVLRTSLESCHCNEISFSSLLYSDFAFLDFLTLYFA